VPTLRQIAERFKQCVRIKWIFVYISEAHAQDVWPISQLGPGREILAHKNIQERAKAAQRFNQEYQLSSFFHTLLLDNMQDDFDRTYHSWPFRFWVIGPSQSIDFKPMPHNATYDVSQLDWFLSSSYSDD